MSNFNRRSIFLGLLSLLWSLVVYAQKAGFSATVTSGCSPLIVNFQDQSTGNIKSWAWDFGNGATSTLQNPATTYFKSGSYTVTLTVTGNSGSNTVSKSSFVVVYGKPVIDFSVSDSAGCFPVRAQFQDHSVAYPGTVNSNWLWDFGDGTQSTDQNPLNVYRTSGTYSVTVKLTNDKGCYSVLSKQSYINVVGGVKSDFSNTTPVVCKPPFNINFTNNSTGPGTLSYLWDFGDGTKSSVPNPNHTYLKTGNYSVSMTTTSSNGCSDTLQKTGLLNFQNIKPQIIAPDSICVLAPVNFSDSSSPSPLNFKWDFGDGSATSNLNSPVKTYAAPGNYTVKLVNTYSYCTDSTSKKIKILPRPLPGFTADNTFKCKPSLTVNFTDQSTNAVSWLWDFGDSTTSTQKNPSHTYSRFGIYDVKLLITNASGCSDSLIKIGYIKIVKPVIQFASLPIEGCLPFTMSPVPKINVVDAITSYVWDFGDGSAQASGNSPPHTYTTQGSYTVSLTITTSTGCSETYSLARAVTVGTHSTVDFNAIPNPVCALKQIQFIDASTATPYNINQWLWMFSDGSSSTLQNPLKRFTDTGLIDVKLIVKNNGCADSLVRNKFIQVEPPIARFNFKPSCDNRLLINFRDSSIFDISKGLVYTWDFGDGSPVSNQQNPTHIFPALGSYNVRLTISNGSCSDSTTNSVTLIKETPDFVADLLNACHTATINFKAVNFNTSLIRSYLWDVENGQLIFDFKPTAQYVYRKSGAFTIKLLTTDLNGCLDSTLKVNYIHITGPTADFSSTSKGGCKGQSFAFNDLSKSDGISNITKWKWNFGDGTVQTFTSGPFKHIYANAGTYTVQLTVTDATGCMDSIQYTDLIHTTEPKAQFTADTLACPGSTVQFINNSIGINYTSQWSFGDNNNSSATSPTNIYTNTGLYDVVLKITDQYGCSDSLPRLKYIKVAKPVASFTVSDSVSSCVPLEVDFTNTSQYYNSATWNLNGGVTSVPNPIQYYVNVGSYPIQLTVTSPGGCTDVATKTIRVYDTAGAKVTYTPLNGCTPLNVDLQGFSPGPLTYTWDLGDGTLIKNNLTSISHVYHAFGAFIPKIIMTDHSGCVIPVTGLDTIQIIGSVPKFGLDKKLLCDSGLINFIDSTTFNDPVSSYTWDFGDGTTSGLTQPSHYYNGPGFYTVSLNVKTQSGCTDTFQLDNIIKIVNSPLFSITGDSVVCVTGFLQDQGVFNRSDTSAVEWLWSFPNGNSSDLQNPTNQQYNKAGDFVITAVVTNSSGCKTNETKNITINPLPVITMPPVITKQAGVPITIPATYSPNIVNYTWQPVTDLNCNDCPQPIATNKFNTKYLVTVVDSNGCKNNKEIEIVVTCKNANVFVPNTFSPNNDGSNDVFYVRGTGLERVKSLRIFNRWGQVVFERTNFPVNDKAYGWNGTYNGSRPIPDVYIYQVEVFCENSEIIRFDGNVALIK